VTHLRLLPSHGSRPLIYKMKTLLICATHLLIVASCFSQTDKPCDSTTKFVDKNMVDYALDVKQVRGSIADPAGAPVPKDCVAVFALDRSTLLRTTEASQDCTFELTGLKSGDYWLVVQDPQRVFCPATARLKVRNSARKVTISVHMQRAGIDRCSYCESR